MKKTTLTCLLPLLIAANPLIAQVKKALAKPAAPAASAKPKPAAVKIPVLTKLDPFSKTPDDLVQFLNDEFKKLNLTLKDIDETTIHLYEGTKKLEQVFSTTKELTFTNSVSATLTADANDKVTDLQIQVLATDSVRHLAVRNMLAFGAWPVISKSEGNTTYKNGNAIASESADHLTNEEATIEDSFWYLYIRQIAPYTYQPKAAVTFNAKAITINDNAEDLGYSVVKLLEGLGFGLLYKQAEEPLTESGKLTGYSTYYQFNNALSAEIETTPFRKLKLIDIDVDDPIGFLKIKKAMGLAGWKMYASDAESKSESYEYGNVRCLVLGDTKSIVFTLTTERSDVISRLQDSEIPSLDDLMNIYHIGTEKEVGAAISSRYVNDYFITSYATPMTFEPRRPENPTHFLIRTDDGKEPANVNFNFGLELPDKIVALNMESKDSVYLQRLCEEFKTSKHNVKYQCQLNTNNKGEIYSLYVIDRELNKQREALRSERMSEDEKKRLQAERDAKAAETKKKIAEFGNMLQKKN